MSQPQETEYEYRSHRKSILKEKEDAEEEKHRRMDHLTIVRCLCLLESQISYVKTIYLSRSFTVWKRWTMGKARLPAGQIQDNLHRPNSPIFRESSPSTLNNNNNDVVDESDFFHDAGEDVLSPDKPLDNRIMQSLKSAYATITEENKAVQSELDEIRQEIKNEGLAKRVSAESKRFIFLIFLKQSLRRGLQHAFDKWHYFGKRTAASIFKNNRNAMLLQVMEQRVKTKEFTLDSVIEHSEQLDRAIICSHSFFKWKLHTARLQLIEETIKGEKERTILFEKFKEIRLMLNKSNAIEKEMVTGAVERGKRITQNIARIKAKLDSASIMTRNVNKLQQNGVPFKWSQEDSSKKSGEGGDGRESRRSERSGKRDGSRSRERSKSGKHRSNRGSPISGETSASTTKAPFQKM